MNLFRTCVLAFLSVAITGCAGIGQIFWSPDGSRAAYISGGDLPYGAVIDSSGKALHDLSVASGFAWSADSKVLYYANSHANTAHDQIAKQLNGQFKRNDDFVDAPLPHDENQGSTVVYAYDGVNDTPLFRVNDRTPATLLTSPDGKWLALAAWREKDKDSILELYAFSLKTRTLYSLANSCGLGTCFTGADRLAFVANSHPGTPTSGNDYGELSEITLSNLEALKTTTGPATGPAHRPEIRARLADVMMEASNWMQSLNGDIFFSTVTWQYPHLASDLGNSPAQQLFRYSRGTGKIIKVADSVGLFFAISPDGKRILFEKMNPSPAGNKSQSGTDGSLAVMNIDGTNVHLLRDLRGYKDLPLLPNWRGSDEITFIPSIVDSPPPDANGKIHFDVVLYRVTDKGLEPIRTLSQSWQPSQKPVGEAAQP